MSYLEWPNPKDPESDRTYTVTWDDLRSGEIIVSSSWGDAPEGLTIGTTSFNDTVTSVKLAGGISGETYDLVNTITTNQGNTIPRTIRLKVKDR